MTGTQGNLRHFVSTTGPGKLAPTLIQDLHLHDPRFPLASGLNVLRDVPLYYSGHNNVAPLLPPNSCHHSWYAKDNQELLPPLDARPEPETIYKFAGLCRKCRMHVEVEANYTGRWESEPCPNPTRPLHHLVHSPWREGGARNESGLGSAGVNHQAFAFECSSPTCSATVFVRLHPPVLSDGNVRLLIDRELLNRRTEEAIAFEPDRFYGYAKPTPADVLSDLKRYLRNCFEPGGGKLIQATNARFRLRFGINGQPCKDVLNFLRFNCDTEGNWQPPQPNHSDAAPFRDPVNIFIDNVALEITVLIELMPENERAQMHETNDLPSAEKSLLRVLGAQDYDKHPSARTAVLDPATRDIRFTALGAPQDASDELVSFAYHEQIRTNGKESPTYLSCLGKIAQNRGSELLQTVVATAYSAGNLDIDKINEAYAYFGFESRDRGISDDFVLGTFRSRLQDSAKHEADMRAHLQIIGQHRHSQRIKDVAEEALNTYEQALAFFEVDATVDDEFILPLYTTKTSEDPALKESARKAVKLIAEERCSTALHSWLSTGQLGERSMDIAEAYQLFNIDDRTIDEGMIESAYKVAMDDNPGQSETYTKAFNAIVADRQSSQLQAPSRGGQSLREVGQPDWPVGLENIGNTCYLNSLLQFLFTIPELRNLVLNFDDVKMELTADNVARKRVGSRQISLREIERAQRFVLKLKDLFLEMIRSPYKFVAPEQELTRLTLMTSTAAENIRRRSTIGGSRPLGTVNGFPVQGPLGPPPDGTNGEASVQAMLFPLSEDGTSAHQISGGDDQEMLDQSETVPLLGTAFSEMDALGDNSSEVTLISTPSVDDSVMVDGASKLDQRQMSNKENLPPNPASAPTAATEGNANLLASPLELSSPVVCDPQAGKAANGVAGEISSEPPTRPPPIPPRPAPVAKQNHTLEEYARQQDVTEVLNHVLFQLSCAIKPTGFDEEGEQVDQIKNLFYGRTKQHIMSDDQDQAKNDRFCSIIVRLFSLPHDIYAALDGYFDVEEIANKKRFLSISQLPPIFQIQIDRAGLDQKKNNHHVELKETIYLDRYLEEETNPALLERRQEAWGWKKELADLEARQSELTADQTHPDAQTTFHDARMALMHLQELSSTGEGGIQVAPSAIATLESLAELTRSELQEIGSRVKDLSTNINSQFADSGFRRHAYRLHAAFFHHGTASSGHYWIYIYDFRREIWLKYNDIHVQEVKDTNEIFRRPSEAEFGQWNGPSNPYYLVYVRDQDKDRWVESVCRDMQPAVDLPREIEMRDLTEAPNGGEVGNGQSEHSVSVPLALRERSSLNGEWDDSEANVATKW